MKALFNNANIDYSISGNGKPLVLLHGFAESKNIWNFFSKELSSDYKVITIDLPGHGDNDCIGKTHTMEDIADCVTFILSSIGVIETIIVGHSMGGYAALAFAEKYPESIKGLCLFHSSALADTAEAKVNRDRTIALVNESHYKFFPAFIPDLVAPDNREKYKEEISFLIEESKKISKDGIIASL